MTPPSSWFSRLARSTDFWLPLAALAGSLWVFAAMADGPAPAAAPAAACEIAPAGAAASSCTPREGGVGAAHGP